MSAKARTAWFWSDWLGDPAVRRLTPAERGLWIDLLGLAADGTPKGYVTDAKGRALSVDAIAKLANCSSAEASDLIRGVVEKGAASRDRAGRLFNRRMVRDEELSAKKRDAGKQGAAATKLKWQQLSNPNLTLPGHVPRHNGTRPIHYKNNLSSENATAHEGQPSGSIGPPDAVNLQTEEALRRQTERREQSLAGFRARQSKHKPNGRPA